MPVPVVAAAAVIPIIVKTVIGAKVIGFVASWVTSPTSTSMRSAFLDHVEHVRIGLRTAAMTFEETDETDLIANIATLRESAEAGWTKPNQTLALWQVMKFLSWAHSKATAVGVGKFTSSHIGAAFEMAEKAGLQILDFILPEKKQ